MTTNFGKLIQVLSGRTVNEETIAARLQTDLEVPATAAQKLAGVLVTSAQQAGILTDDRFDAEEIEAVVATLPAPPAEPSLARPNLRRSLDPGNGGKKRQPSGEPRIKEAQKGAKLPLVQHLSSTSSLNLTLELNVGHLSVEELVTLVQRLKSLPES
jgi:hypothetical protein